MERDSEVPIDSNTSSRIEILRFPLIVAVVFIHNDTTAVRVGQASIGVAHSAPWVDFVRFFISQGVARVAVPLFFLISGYLFFFGEWSWERYAHKLKRRLRTLLIPFLVWNLATLALFALEPVIPHAENYFTFARSGHSHSIFGLIDTLFGLTTQFPISYQFWFIRDLMALVVLAPAIQALVSRKSALPFIAVLFCLWLFDAWPVLWPNVEATFFFCLGAYLARPNLDVSYLDRFGPWIGALFLGSLILHSVFPDDMPFLYNIVIILGVPTAWWLAGLAVGTTQLNAWLIGLSGASFFVFAAHEPLLKIVRKISYLLFSPTSGAAILALYLLLPLCLIALLVLIHRLLLKTVPSIVGVITGSSQRSNWRHS
jgi:surface polysaccharide O-acyltransferase-like enzyme